MKFLKSVLPPLIIVVLLLSSYWISKVLSNIIPDVIAIALFILGISLFLFGKVLSKFANKKSYNESNEIILDNPFLFDLAKLMGSVLMLIGFVGWSFFFSFLNALWDEGGLYMLAAIVIGALVPILFIISGVMNYMKLKNSLHDKIIITENTLYLPIDISSKNYNIYKKDLLELVHLQTWTVTGKNRFRDSYEFVFKLSHGKAISYDPDDLNIGHSEFIESVTEKGWTVKKCHVVHGDNELKEGWESY
jgi:hypothetical protein